MLVLGLSILAVAAIMLLLYFFAASVGIPIWVVVASFIAGIVLSLVSWGRGRV